MSNKARRLLLVALCAVALPVSTAAPASAIHEPNWFQCENDFNRANLFQVSTTAARQRCFAGAGDMHTDVRGVIWMNSGDNAGWAKLYWGGGRYTTWAFQKHDSYVGLGNASTLVYLHID